MSPYVLAPLSLMFQGLPGPVGDPGPKGSRVSGPWQVPYMWGPGWVLPVPPVGLRAIRAGRPPASVYGGTGAGTLPPECILESRVAAGGPDDGELMSQAWSHGWADWAQQRVHCWLSNSPAATIRHLLAMCPSTSQVLGIKARPLRLSLESSETSLLLLTEG